jgi:hypothetical protein
MMVNLCHLASQSQGLEPQVKKCIKHLDNRETAAHIGSVIFDAHGWMLVEPEENVDVGTKMSWHGGSLEKI